jgi:hypothetical protein
VTLGGVEYINLFFFPLTFGAPRVLYFTPEHMKVGFNVEFSSKKKNRTFRERKGGDGRRLAQLWRKNAEVFEQASRRSNSTIHSYVMRILNKRSGPFSRSIVGFSFFQSFLMLTAPEVDIKDRDRYPEAVLFS